MSSSGRNVFPHLHLSSLKVTSSGTYPDPWLAKISWGMVMWQMFAACLQVMKEGIGNHLLQSAIGACFWRSTIIAELEEVPSHCQMLNTINSVNLNLMYDILKILRRHSWITSHHHVDRGCAGSQVKPRPWAVISLVVYLDQRLGVAHYKCWSKYAFAMFLCKNLKKQEICDKI